MSSVETGQMSAVETGQMSAAETGQMSAVETRQMLKSQIKGRAQDHQYAPKWVQNGRQDTRIGQNESNSGPGAFPTGPGAKNLAKKPETSKSACPGPRSRVRLLKFYQRVGPASGDALKRFY